MPDDSDECLRRPRSLLAIGAMEAYNGGVISRDAIRGLLLLVGATSWDTRGQGLNQMHLRTTIICLIFVALLPLLGHADVYSGYLTADPDDPYFGIVTGGGYAGSILPRIEWTVTRIETGWRYEYWIQSGSPSPSHWLLEVSAGDDPFAVQAPDFTNVYTDPGVMSEYVQMQPGDGPNSQPHPYMPEDMYAVKWDSIQDQEPPSGVYGLYYRFESTRNPVWGDFYVKAGGTPNPAVFWNAGFTVNDYDPMLLPQDGALQGHILRPDGAYVPEPATTALFGLGVASLIGSRLRRRHKD